MGDILDPFNIIILVIAGVVLYRLYAVLGARTGHEQPPRRPEPRPDRADTPARDAETTAGDKTRGENVIPLPGPAERANAETVEPVDAAAAPETPVERALAAITAVDRRFERGEFLEGAAYAYEMIVTAFAAGDRRGLKPLLSAEVLDGFSRAIDERAAAGHTMETTFVGIEKAEIVDAGMQGKTARIKVRFVAEMVNVVRDREGGVVSGDPAKVETLIDGWTFERVLTSSDPNWVLVATETMD